MLNRVVALTTLLVLSNFMSYSQNGNSVEDVSDTVILKNVIIHENRLQVPFTDSNRSIAILERKDLDDLPVNSLAEALSNVAGVDVRSRGQLGTQADISIRGSSFDENLVLINGMKLTDPQTGHHLMNLPISFFDVERVEILKGASARIYGQNAYSGSINIITKDITEDFAQFSLMGGIGATDSKDSDTLYYDFGVYTSVGLKGQKLSHLFSFSRNESNGYRYNSDYAINNLYYQGALSAIGGKFKFQAGHSWREFGANGFYSGNEEREKISTTLLSMEFEKVINKYYYNIKAYERRNLDNYVYNWQNPQWFHNVHLTNSFGFEFHNTFQNSLGTTGIGVEFRGESIEGIEEKQIATNPLLDDDYRTNYGIYLEHRYDNGWFSLTPGIYINNHSDFGWSAFPGIDLGIEITQKLKLFSNIGRTYRVPTFFDLYYYSVPAKTFGDPNLKPGIANNYEAGLKFFDKNTYLEFTGFIIDGKSTIDWVNDPNIPDVTWQATNFDNILKKGFEITTNFDFSSSTKGVIENIEINYTYINSDLQNEDFKSRYALANLRHQFNLNVTHKIIGKLSNTISYKYRSRPTASDQDFINGTIPYNNYSLLDIKLKYKLAKGNMFLQGSNLLDTEYVEVGNVPMPGRWWRAGLSITLK